MDISAMPEYRIDDISPSLPRYLTTGIKNCYFIAQVEVIIDKNGRPTDATLQSLEHAA